MIVASGFVEVDAVESIDEIVAAIKGRGFEVSAVEGDKIVYLVEREVADDVRPAIDALQRVEGVRGVYLTYYSLEGADAAPSPG